MQQILAIARKEFQLWTQKPGSWITVFLVPLIFIWIMQAVFGSSGTPIIHVFAVDEDQSSESAQVLKALEDSPNLEIERLDSREDADRRVGSGDRMAAVIVPKDYHKDLLTPKGARIELLVDPARAEQANILNGLVNAAISPLLINAEVNRKIENSVSGIVAAIDQTPTPEIADETAVADETATDNGLDALEPTVTPSDEDLLNEGSSLPGNDASGEDSGLLPEETPSAEETGEPTIDLSGEDANALKQFFSAAIQGVVASQVQDGIDHPLVEISVQPNQGNPAMRRPTLLDSLAPGYALMFMFFLIPNLALTVVEERQHGTLQRLLITPVTRSQILFGKMLPYFLIALVQLIFVIGMSKLVFNLSLGNFIVGWIIMMMTSALVMVSLGILIAAMARTAGHAEGLSIIIVVAMAVVSGAMFPSISVPGLQYITPHYWALQGFINLGARMQGIEGILRPAGVLLTLSAVFFTIGAIRFRFEEP